MRAARVRTAEIARAKTACILHFGRNCAQWNAASAGRPRATRIRRRARPFRSCSLSFLLRPSQPLPPVSPIRALSILIWILDVRHYVFRSDSGRRCERQKEQQRLVSALKTGDRVVTAAGIHGMITNVKDTTVTVKVADNVKIEMEKSAVSNVLKPSEAKLR